MDVKKIHESHLFGIVSEVGCSATIASHLMDEPGASNTIYYSNQPYNKLIQDKLYDSNYWSRSVSQEYVTRVLNVEIDNLPSNGNFVLATSWQLNDNDPKKYCHGWFGLWLKETDTKHYLHFSFERNNTELKTRKDYLDKIGEIGIAILSAAINHFNDLQYNIYDTQAILDMAYIHKNNIYGIDYDLVIGALENSKKDYPLVFSHHEMIRIEDLARKSKNIIIEKGSFHPMHKAHKEMLEISLGMIEDSSPACLISTFTYDKPHIDIDDLVQRINFINAQDYPVIICKEIYFYNTFTLLENYLLDNNLFFPIGSDTLKRIYKTDVDYLNSIYAIEKYLMQGIALEVVIKDVIKDIFLIFKVNSNKNKFIHFNRIGETLNSNIFKFYEELLIQAEYTDDGVSSTKIRNGEIKNILC